MTFSRTTLIPLLKPEPEIVTDKLMQRLTAEHQAVISYMKRVTSFGIRGFWGMGAPITPQIFYMNALLELLKWRVLPAAPAQPGIEIVLHHWHTRYFQATTPEERHGNDLRLQLPPMSLVSKNQVQVYFELSAVKALCESTPGAGWADGKEKYCGQRGIIDEGPDANGVYGVLFPVSKA